MLWTQSFAIGTFQSIIATFRRYIYCYRDPKEVAADLLRYRDQSNQDTNASI